jgi:hypothetical protein
LLNGLTVSFVILALGHARPSGLWHWFRRAGNFVPLFVVNGVTSVRDMGNELTLCRVAQRDRSGNTGPRIRTSGPMLDTEAALSIMRTPGLMRAERSDLSAAADFIRCNR